jgi:predicted nucleic acid-binding Zn finger protein
MAYTVIQVVPSASRPNAFYEIREGADEVIYCTCPSWRFQSRKPGNRSCKHLQAFMQGMVEATRQQIAAVGQRLSA